MHQGSNQPSPLVLPQMPRPRIRAQTPVQKTPLVIPQQYHSKEEKKILTALRILF